jgi:hypothetical protein
VSRLAIVRRTGWDDYFIVFGWVRIYAHLVFAKNNALKLALAAMTLEADGFTYRLLHVV